MSGLLPDFATSAIGAVRDQTLTQAIQILAYSEESDGAGGQTRTWSVSSTVSGRVRKPTHRPGEWKLLGEREQLIEHYQMLFDPGTPITGENRLQIGDQVFVVRGVDDARTNPLVLIVDCDPVDGAGSSE